MKKRLIIFSTLLLSILAIILCSCSTNNNEALNEYSINITLDVDNKSLSCEQTITYYNNTNTTLNEMCLNLYANAFSEGSTNKPYLNEELTAAFPNDVSYGGINITSVLVSNVIQRSKKNVYNAENLNFAVSEVTYSENNMQIYVPCNEFFPNEAVQIKLTYTVLLPESFMRMGYNEISYNLANFYPVAACYDEYGYANYEYLSYGDPFYTDVANYVVNITTPKTYTVAATGIQNSESINGVSKTLSYTAEKVRDIAIVCYSNGKVLEQVVGDTTVKYYYTQDNNATNNLQVAVNSIRTFNELFGNYPYPVYNVCQVNFNEGGMEYPMLTYISKNDDNDFYEKVIIHETAHQWWYGVVGSNSLKYAWLDEGLTEFSTALYYKFNDDKQKMDSMIDEAYKKYSLYVAFNNKLMIEADSTMSRENLSSFASGTEYYYITYVKGMLMFSSLYEILGEASFLQAMKMYYSENLYKNATPNDLIYALEKTTKKNIEPLFESWLEGKIIFSGIKA